MKPLVGLAFIIEHYAMSIAAIGLNFDKSVYRHAMTIEYRPAAEMFK